MPRFHNINGENVQFTAEEETARDAEEAQSDIDKAAERTAQARKATLDAKLMDDTITFDELKELMRF